MAPPQAEKPKTTGTPAPAAGAPGFAILDLHEEAGPDPSLVRIVGTVVNRSNQQVERPSVRIEARDPAGRVLSRVVAPVSADVLPPDTSATFEASMPRSGSIRDYNAEVIPR